MPFFLGAVYGALLAQRVPCLRRWLNQVRFAYPAPGLRLRRTLPALCYLHLLAYPDTADMHQDLSVDGAGSFLFSKHVQFQRLNLVV